MFDHSSFCSEWSSSSRTSETSRSTTDCNVIKGFHCLRHHEPKTQPHLNWKVMWLGHGDEQICLWPNLCPVPLAGTDSEKTGTLSYLINMAAVWLREGKHRRTLPDFLLYSPTNWWMALLCNWKVVFCDFQRENCSQGSVFRGSEEFVYELLCCVHKLREFGLCRLCYEILSFSHFKKTILSCRGFFFL